MLNISINVTQELLVSLVQVDNGTLDNILLDGRLDINLIIEKN